MSTILIIDDDVFGRNIFARALAEHEITVLHSDSVFSARAILSNESVDLVLVDAQLDGGAPLQLAMQLHFDVGTPILVLDSVFDAATKKDTTTPTVAVLHRPVSPAEVNARVLELLGGEERELRDTGEERRKGQVAFAHSLLTELAQLESTIRELHEDQVTLDAPLSMVDALEGDARALGLTRVAQALSRVRQVLLKLEGRHGQMNRELWAELNDSMDDAGLGTHFLLAQRGRARERDSTTRQQSRVLVYDHDYDSVRLLIDFGNRHLIEVVHVSNDDDFRAELVRDDFDGLFIDIDVCGSRQSTMEMVEGLFADNRLNSPVAFLGAEADFSSRIQAARAGALRFLEKPMELTEFADAVRHFVSQHRAETSRVILCDRDDAFALEATQALEHAGYEVHRVDAEADFPRLLDRLDPHCLLLNQNNGAYPGVDICRALRAMPRWTDLPVVLLSDVNDVVLERLGPTAGADEVAVKPVHFEALVPKLWVSIQRYRTQRERSDYDLLTGVLTRRAFLERVAVRLSEARRRGRSLAIALLDLDRFKLVNDTYGHLPGDRVLNAMGRLLRKSFRLEDLACRWGGEEFAVALIDETSSGAKLALERTLDDFRKIEFVGENGEKFTCSFSAGIAQFPEDGDQFEALLTRADERLFDAKIAGRCRIHY